jgi:hypothetical protein
MLSSESKNPDTVYTQGFKAGQKFERQATEERIIKLLEEEPRIFVGSLVEPNLLIEAIRGTL